MTQAAESIEAEAALVRAQLVAAGGDIRRHADPAVIVNAAKSSFKRRVQGAPSLLKANATPISMVLLGGALGAAVTGLFSRSRRSPSGMSPVTNVVSSGKSGVRSPLGSQANAALLSSVGVGLGYLAGMFVPASSTEERLLGQPKAVLAQHLDEFLQEHTRGMKMAAANLFGLSRLSATTLIGLAMIAEALGTSARRSKPDSL